MYRCASTTATADAYRNSVDFLCRKDRGCDTRIFTPPRNSLGPRQTLRVRIRLILARMFTELKRVEDFQSLYSPAENEVTPRSAINDPFNKCYIFARPWITAFPMGEH